MRKTLTKPKHTVLEETTIVGYWDEITAGILRAREDGRVVEYRNGPVTMPDGKTAITVAMEPLRVPLVHRPVHVRMWQWITDGGIVWLGLGIVGLVVVSAVGLFVVAVLRMLGMVSDFVTNYGAAMLGIMVVAMLLSMLGGSKGGGAHCPGPWHK